MVKKNICPTCKSGGLHQMYFRPTGKLYERTGLVMCDSCGAIFRVGLTKIDVEHSR